MKLDGRKVRRLREDQGMTVTELAHAAQLSKAFVSMVERHQRNSSPRTALRLAQALGCAVADLREKDDEQ